MWINRQEYTDLVSKAAQAEQIDRLDREISYWRGKFEDEKARADRIGDQVFAMEGRPPVSTRGMVEARRTAADIAAEAQRSLEALTGVFEEDDGSDVVDEDGMMRIEPEVLEAISGGK